MSTLTEPAKSAFVVTPADSAFSNGLKARALFVGTGGNVNVLMADGVTVLYSNVQDGTLLPVRCNGVYTTSTTASNIVALV